MSDEFDLSSVQITDAAGDVPNYRASEDEPPPQPTTPEAGAQTRKRRLLPGSRDQMPRSERKPLPPIPRNGFAPEIEKFYTALAMAVMAWDVELSSQILAVAPEAAKAWDELARKNHAVRRLIVQLLETSAWGAVIAAHAPIFLLMVRRVTGESVRETLLSSRLGAEAEAEARRHADGGESAA